MIYIIYITDIIYTYIYMNIYIYIYMYIYIICIYIERETMNAEYIKYSEWKMGKEKRKE